MVICNYRYCFWGDWVHMEHKCMRVILIKKWNYLFRLCTTRATLLHRNIFSTRFVYIRYFMSKHLHTVSEGILTELYSKYVQNTSESLSERAPNILGTRAKRLRSKSLMNARVFVQIFLIHRTNFIIHQMK